jgi:monoamine oxidase
MMESNQATEAESRVVVIVGGGFAGLSAAYKLKQLAPDVSFVVLEAGQVLGGRTETAGCDRDFGAGYVGQSQNHVQFLIRALQIPTEPTWLEKTQHWYYHRPDSEVQAFPGDNPLIFPGIPNALYRLGELDIMSLEVRRNLNEPWKLSQAKAWDSITVKEWMDEQCKKYRKGNETEGMSPETAKIFTASVRAAFSLEPEELSFFFLLYYAACAGTYSALVDIAGGDGTAEGTRFKFGTRDAIDRLVRAVDDANIRTDERVKTIESTAKGVLVTTTRGTWQAAKVILALSPPATCSITCVGLPDAEYKARQELCSAMNKLGRTIKGFVRFRSPAWRTRNCMGYMLSMADYQEFPVGWTLDNVWEPTGGVEGCTETRYSLMTFIGGEAASHWGAAGVTARQRGEAVVRHLKRVFGLDDSDFHTSNPVDSYEEVNWLEREGVPAPTAVMPPGVLSDPRLGSALRRAIGPVHFAGTETSTEWCGYMNGAIESGFRAASEVLETLPPP